TCGNDDQELTELCDGTDVNGTACGDLGYSGGTLGCKADCSAYDITACTGQVCGDDVVMGTETCDGPDLQGESCLTRGYNAGVLGCEDDCLALNEAGCFNA